MICFACVACEFWPRRELIVSIVVSRHSGPLEVDKEDGLTESPQCQQWPRAHVPCTSVHNWQVSKVSGFLARNSDMQQNGLMKALDQEGHGSVQKAFSA